MIAILVKVMTSEVEQRLTLVTSSYHRCQWVNMKPVILDCLHLNDLLAAPAGCTVASGLRIALGYENSFLYIKYGSNPLC